MTLEHETNKKEMAAAHQNYHKALKTHAFFKVHDHELGEDLVQDTFLKTWAYLVKGGKIDVMKAFLYHVLNNLIIDEYRKKKPSSLDLLLEKGYEPAAPELAPAFSNMESKSAVLLIQSLPVKYRKIMRMRYVQDLSLQEMSILTGQTKNSLAVQVHRGLEKLKLLYIPIVT